VDYDLSIIEALFLRVRRWFERRSTNQLVNVFEWLCWLPPLIYFGFSVLFKHSDDNMLMLSVVLMLFIVGCSGIVLMVRKEYRFIVIQFKGTFVFIYGLMATILCWGLALGILWFIFTGNNFLPN
jgi:hypothetical protein